jgi:hypothetical protein
MKFWHGGLSGRRATIGWFWTITGDDLGKGCEQTLGAGVGAALEKALGKLLGKLSGSSSSWEVEGE